MGRACHPKRRFTAWRSASCTAMEIPASRAANESGGLGLRVSGIVQMGLLYEKYAMVDEGHE